MDFWWLLLCVFYHVAARRKSNTILINAENDCKSRSFIPGRTTYEFTTSSRGFKCDIPISIPTYYGHRQYCIVVNSVKIHQSCPVELRIYKGLTSFAKTPEVTLTCDKTVASRPVCVWGVGEGVFIEYYVYSASTDSKIVLKITDKDIPITTTVITRNEYDEDSQDSTLLLPLLSILAVMVLLCLCVYYCCCRKNSQSGEVIRDPPNTHQPVFSEPLTQEQSVLPPRPSAPHIAQFSEPPPSYATTASLPLVEPSAPTLEMYSNSDHPMIPNEDPPPYESVMKNNV